jgi:hypothetical protein
LPECPVSVETPTNPPAIAAAGTLAAPAYPAAAHRLQPAVPSAGHRQADPDVDGFRDEHFHEAKGPLGCAIAGAAVGHVGDRHRRTVADKPHGSDAGSIARRDRIALRECGAVRRRESRRGYQQSPHIDEDFLMTVE